MARERSGGDDSWAVIDQIDRGAWPIEVEVALENIAEFPQIKLRAAAERSEFGEPPEFPQVRVKVRVEQSRVSGRFFEIFLSVLERGYSGLPVLGGICWADREFFLQVAPEYFAIVPRGVASGREENSLPFFVIELHERDPELFTQLVERTERIDRRAARRLRDMILDVIDEPPCSDALGLLGAAALRDRLEE